MSDRDLNINIRTTADTSGADQTTEADVYKRQDIISSRISKIKERIEEEKLYFNPSYGVDKKGNPITDEQRTEEYKTAFKPVSYTHLEPKVQGLRLIVSYNFTLGRPL